MSASSSSPHPSELPQERTALAEEREGARAQPRGEGAAEVEPGARAAQGAPFRRRLGVPTLDVPRRDLGESPQSEEDLWACIHDVTSGWELGREEAQYRRTVEMPWLAQQLCGPVQWDWIGARLRDLSANTKASRALWEGCIQPGIPIDCSPAGRLLLWLSHAQRLPRPMEEPDRILTLLDAMSGIVELQHFHVWVVTYLPTVNRDGHLHHLTGMTQAVERDARLPGTTTDDQPDPARRWMAWSAAQREQLTRLCRTAIGRAHEERMHAWFAARLLELEDAEAVGLPDAWGAWIASLWGDGSVGAARRASATPAPFRNWMARYGLDTAQRFEDGLLGRPDWTPAALDQLREELSPAGWARVLRRVAWGGAVPTDWIRAAVTDPAVEMREAARVVRRWQGAATTTDDRVTENALREAWRTRVEQTPLPNLLTELDDDGGGPLSRLVLDLARRDALSRSVVRGLLQGASPTFRIQLVGALAVSRGEAPSGRDPVRAPTAGFGR